MPAAGALQQRCPHRPRFVVPASRTTKTLRPAELTQILSTGLLGGETRLELGQIPRIIFHFPDPTSCGHLSQVNTHLNAFSSGTIADVFTLGNYVFGPPFSDDGAIVELILDDSRVYEFDEVRSGFPNDLADRYVGIAIDKLLKSEVLLGSQSESLALATQLVSWSERYAPERVPVLDSLLNAQTAVFGTPSHLGALQKLLQPMSEDDLMASLEAQLESAVDAKTKAELSFVLCYHYIRQGEFNRVENLIDDLKPELRRPIANIMELKRTTMAFESDNLGDAASKVVSLKDSLHQVLASLSLASAYWTRSEKTPESLEDREAADRALQIAMSSTESVPDFLRPNARTAVASLLAKCGHHEDALRMLELAVQELNTDRPHEEGEEPAAVVRYDDSGHFAAAITDGEQTLYFDLVPLKMGIYLTQVLGNSPYMLWSSVARVAVPPTSDL